MSIWMQSGQFDFNKHSAKPCFRQQQKFHLISHFGAHMHGSKGGVTHIGQQYTHARTKRVVFVLLTIKKSLQGYTICRWVGPWAHIFLSCVSVSVWKAWSLVLDTSKLHQMVWILKIWWGLRTLFTKAISNMMSYVLCCNLFHFDATINCDQFGYYSINWPPVHMTA